ncbi:MAG: Cytokinin riboside 5-monophosphate phosphoribohydrolase [Parcubacteria group bacterium]|nr:Cytokinin riboside 5-monophosphate phosphoribohydrolase [Parcubacteria group bacterium]
MGDELKISTEPDGELDVPGLPAAIGEGENKERSQRLGSVLAEAIQHGKDKVPAVPAPLVCKPQQLESWRVFKIMAEFVDGFDLLKKYGLSATFFGSVRTQPEDPYYKAAVALAGKLAKSGYAIISGGSAGIMEAANRGAHEAGGASVGLNIRLSDNQTFNKYLTDSMVFDHFFVRKVMLAFASEVYVYFPGGFGTLDELTEILTLVQTKKIKPVPIVLYGKEFWTPIVDLFKNELFAKYHNIDKADLNLFVLLDSVDEAYDYIIKNVTSC